MDLQRTGYFSEMEHAEETDPSIKEHLHKLPKKNLENIIHYLLGGILVIMCPGNTTDVINPQNGNAGAPSVYTDGKWAWPGDLVYYVKNYQVGLEQGFLDDMERNNWTVPFREEDLTNADISIDGIPV